MLPIGWAGAIETDGSEMAYTPIVQNLIAVKLKVGLKVASCHPRKWGSIKMELSEKDHTAPWMILTVMIGSYIKQELLFRSSEFHNRSVV